jgi:hypothetical protein
MATVVVLGLTSKITRCAGSEAGNLSASTQKSSVRPAALQSLVNRFIQTMANCSRRLPNRSDSAC